MEKKVEKFIENAKRNFVDRGYEVKNVEVKDDKAIFTLSNYMFTSIKMEIGLGLID